MILPQTGWRRAANYLGHRVRRLPDSPHRIALGISCGVFVSFSPLFGLHFFVAAFLAYIFRANVIAGLIGTAMGNPFTFPAIAGSSLWVGGRIVGGRGEHLGFVRIQHAFVDAFAGTWNSFKSIFGYGHNELYRMGGFLHDVFLPYIVGGAIVGLLVATLTYFISLPIIRKYQLRRRERLMERARARRAARKEDSTSAKDEP
ncbi:MAG: DUF2062 domain-containing protein [Paracoccaceae bacterium]